MTFHRPGTVLYLQKLYQCTGPHSGICKHGQLTRFN